MRRADVLRAGRRAVAAAAITAAGLGCTGPQAGGAGPARRGDRASATAPPDRDAEPAGDAIGLVSSSPRPDASPTARKRTYRVAAIGDSLTDARSKGGAFLEVLRERCPMSRFDNFGVGGQMVNQMRARFARQVLGPDDGGAPWYTDALVWGGVNDLYSDETAARTVPRIEADLGAMYDAARARGLRVVAVTVAPWGGFKAYWRPSRRATTLELNDWIRGAVARGQASFVVDAWALLSCGAPDELCPSFARRDGLHITTSGQRKLGERLHEGYFADCE